MNEKFEPNIDLKQLAKTTISEEEIRKIYEQGPEAVVFWGLQMAKLLAEAKGELAKGEPSPSTPSGNVAPYLKPEPKKRKRKKGREVGHEGAHRVSPEPDEVVELGLECCPECGGPVSKCRGKSTFKHRVIEDIPEDAKVETTRYDIPSFWCPNCKKAVSPKVPDALPNATIGNRLAILTAWLHYANGSSISQIIDLFNFHMPVKLTSGGLVGIWARLAEILRPWYDEIRDKCLTSAVLHGDESGWRVDGETRWLWCFSTRTETYYFIDKSRGKPALQEFFKEFYDGVLVTDFWGPYASVRCDGQQKCLVHLLREFKKVEKYRDSSDDWPAFSKKLKRLIRDAIRLRRDRRPDLSPETYAHRRALLESRLTALLTSEPRNPEALRLVKRLKKYRDSLFLFLTRSDVPFDNNHAERAIRPAVLMRKTSHGNRTSDGSDTQSILMTVFRTLRQRRLNPTATLAAALRQFVLSGKLPELEAVTSKE